MFNAILENIALGFAITAVPGAVFFEVMRRSLLDYGSLFKFLSGNFVGMIVIILATYLGVASLLSGAVTSVIFYVVSGLLLIYLGISAIRIDSLKLKNTQNKPRPGKTAYLSGLTLALANPLSILFWASLMGRFRHETSGGLGVLMLSLSVVLGSLLLFVALISVSIQANKKLKTDHLVLLSRVFGVVIAVFGVMTLVAAK